jgi:hypothetical protein
LRCSRIRYGHGPTESTCGHPMKTNSVLPRMRCVHVAGLNSDTRAAQAFCRRLRREQPLGARILTYYAFPVCDSAGSRRQALRGVATAWQVSTSCRPIDTNSDARPTTCLRCGFEFGNDDDPGTAAPVSFDQYRDEWEAEDRPWFD